MNAHVQVWMWRVSVGMYLYSEGIEDFPTCSASSSLHDCCLPVGSAVTSSIDETVLIAIVCIIGALLLIVSLSFGGYCLFAFVKARRCVHAIPWLCCMDLAYSMHHNLHGNE